MILDAAWLARGWLSVYAAAATDKDRPTLFRTVYIEEHLHGVRLSATDASVFLTAWIPETDSDLEPEPGLDEVPDHVAIARDIHGRAANLLAHLLKLATAEDAKPIEVRLRLGVPVTDAGDDATMSFDGLDTTAVVIDHPDHERIQLSTIDGAFPDWRPLFAAFKPVRTDTVGLNPEILARLAKVAKLHGSGTESWFKWRWGGSNKAASVEFGAGEPTITGLVMPITTRGTEPEAP